MKVRRSILSLAFVLLALLALAAASAPAVTVSGPKGKRELDAAQLATLPRTSVKISDHGVKATFEGTELANLLALVGAPAGKALHGNELQKYIIITGGDGYRAVVALAEADRSFSSRRIILADRRNGKPLPAKEGAFRLIVEADKRQGRCVRNVATIAIESLP